MKSKGGKKGGGGGKRTISDAKRKNIRRHKLVKQGKAKPKSNPKYIPNQGNNKSKDKKDRQQLTTAEQQARAAETDRERDDALAQLAQELPQDEVEHIMKSNRKRKSSDDDEEDMDEFEQGALNRIHAENDSSKKLKPMLPIKTKAGWKERTIEVEAENEDGEGDEDEEGGEEEEEKEGESGEEIGGEVDDHKVVPGEEVSVVELYARRKELLREKKLLIGSLASAFLEEPEERILNLEKLVKLVDAPQAESVQMSVQRLAAASVLECLKDVTPGYRIFHQDTGEQRLKKETLRLQKYESGLLKSYKSYLLKLEKLVNIFKVGKKSQPKDPLVVKQGEFFLSCMCTLLVEHPHFNYANNILHAITPILDSGHPDARRCVKQTIEKIFKGDMRGEISLEATRLINHLVKSRKHNVKVEVVDVLRSLRIKDVNLDKEKEAEIEMKKKEARRQKLLEKNHISRQEKKRKKRLEQLNKELLEAKGEEGKKVKEKFFTEATKIVFTIYFRVLKSFPRSNLMGSVLEGVAKFAHVINVEFFSDLISVFQSLLAADFLSNRDSLLLVSAVFTILSGQGEALNIDPASFYTHLYNILFTMEPFRSHDDLPLALESLTNMIIKRRKRVSKARVLAFSKRLGTLSLQVLHNGAIGCLSLLREIVITHTVTAQLLDSQHEVGSGVFDASIENPEHCSASNTTSWELTLLRRHYHPPTAKLAGHISTQCPSSGELAISQELKKPAAEIFTDFSMDEMSFNPAIKPPASIKKSSKKQPSSTPTSININMEDIKLCDSIDFHAAAVK